MASTDLPATPATLVQQIAANVLGVAAATIPWSVVEHTKALIFDSIGCALAAAEEPAFARASRVFAQLGGNPDCTVIGSARRVNLPQAVLLNGILIRSLDLNDAYIGPGQMGHPSDNIAVALSVGEKFRASGLSVIASVALAVVRTGQLANSKASANAMVASQAVLCSLFAAEGMTGPLGLIEHPRGLSTGMLAGAKLDLLAQPIGERYRIMTSAIKAYPCIGTAQTLV